MWPKKKKRVLGIWFCVHFPPHLHLIQQVLSTPKPASVSPNIACLSHHLSPGCLQRSFNSSSGLYHSAASGRCFKHRSNPFYPPPNTHSHCIQHRSLSLPKRSQCGMVSAQTCFSIHIHGTKLHDHIKSASSSWPGYGSSQGLRTISFPFLHGWPLLSRGSQVTCHSVRKIFPTQRSHLPHHSVAFSWFSLSTAFITNGTQLGFFFFSNLLTWISSAFLLEYQLQEGRDLS